VVDKALANLRDNGFINYFGQQRFGVESTIKTSDIGLALIKSQWQEAIELIMKVLFVISLLLFASVF
jgi:tRNA(Glu) U13 pseudouridine synthase TruD